MKKIIKEKKLFSPGPVPSKCNIDISFSHRSKEFSKLVKSVENKLRKRFKLGKEWKIVFTQGSGSSAIETILHSLKDDLIYLHVIDKGTFGHRARELVRKYKLNILPYKEYGVYYVLFETSKSLYDETIYDRGYNLVIVDMVSALGYYPIPKNADVVISSSSKILSGLPVMGIIFIKKSKLKYFEKKKGYLDLITYLESYKDRQTPHTSLLPQFISLDKALNNPITKRQIDKNCEALKIENKDIKVTGDKCPVKTIKVKDMNKVLKEFKKHNIEVYYNPKYMKNYFQVSMFNYKDTKYYELIKEILEKI